MSTRLGSDRQYETGMLLVEKLSKEVLSLAEAGLLVSAESVDLRKKIAENIIKHAADIAAFAALASDAT